MDEQKPNDPKDPLFKKQHTYELDAIIKFLKMCGYRETSNEGEYEYFEDRKTLTQIAGARHRQIVRAEDLAASKDKLGRFVRRMLKKKPELRAHLEEAWARGGSPVPPEA